MICGEIGQTDEAMKKLIALLILAVFSSIAFAGPKQLTSFTAIMNHLKSGGKVNLVLDYGQMQLKVDNEVVESPKAIGGMTLEPWEFFEKGVVRNENAYVVSSETHMISSTRYGFVFNYVRVRIYDNEKVEVNAKYVTTDYKQTVMDETFYGEISKKKDDKKGVGAFAQ